jgi:hypothetical protein
MAGHNRTTVVLQERDLRLLEALESMRVINREQAKVVAGFRSTRRANDRLLILTRGGFLKRAFIGSREAVYWLASRPLQDKKRKDADASVEPAALFLKHQLEINRIRLPGEVLDSLLASSHRRAASIHLVNPLMRYCHNCHKVTTGEPLFCHCCGFTYDAKLCTARHINPRWATVCSQCGSRDLTTPAPRVRCLSG